MELQPNASAPLLRTSKARRDWIEQEMELCSTSWQYQKVRTIMQRQARLVQYKSPCADSTNTIIP